MANLFITGTDTGVGKTRVASLIARSLANAGTNVGVMKPVESGCRPSADGLIAEDALLLARAAGVEDSLDDIVPYRFLAPLAPAEAARLEGKTIRMETVLSAYRRLAEKRALLIVEGAGGLLAPIAEGWTACDLIASMEAETILTVGLRLGAINHTLLTLEALASANLKTRAVALNHLAIPNEASENTVSWLRRNLDFPIIEIPFDANGRSTLLEVESMRILGLGKGGSARRRG